MQISKERKIELFIVGLLSLIILSSFINFRNIHIKFHNKTGEDLDSLIVAGTLIGHLKSDGSTEYIDFKEFRFDDDLPYEQISSIINNKKIHQLNWSWCGTGRNTKSKGSYSFDLKKQIDEKGNVCLYLVERNKKMFWEEN
ncbi:hypothetical protein D3C85_532100 [compost metagenome]